MNQELKEPQRQTVGKISSDLLQKRHNAVDPIAVQREALKEYIPKLNACVDDGKKKYAGDFFVVCLTKAERTMENVFTNVFFHRHTCPTSEYDQSVYMYVAQSDDIKYLWTVPCKDACIYLRRHKDVVVPEERASLLFVLAFYDGTLDALAKKMNGEKEELDTVSTIISLS